jgi:glycosyltransferase involved in cell wall biosynthesis
VVTDVGDSAWMVSDTGRVVPSRDPHALASACEELLEIGPAGRQALGAAARSRVTELFSLSSIVARYEALYQNSVLTAPLGEGKTSEVAFQTVSKNA